MKRIFLLLLIFLFHSLLFSKEYQVNLSKQNVVKFISDAPIENFEGVTSNIDGYIKLNSLEDLSDNSIYFEVDLNTLDTGIGLRNRHMRDNYLETDKYQYTFFEGSFISITKISENEYSVMVSGKLFIHGVTKDVTIYGKLYTTESGIRVISTFEVNLSDYNIEVPEMMFVKIDETMQLELDFYIKLMEQK